MQPLEKTSKFDKRTRMFIPDSRVSSTTSVDSLDFQAKLFLILYPSLENSTTHITIACIAKQYRNFPINVLGDSGYMRVISSSHQYRIQYILTLIGMREGTIHPLVFFGSDFSSRIFITDFQTFLEVKIDINRVNLTPFSAYQAPRWR